MLQVHVSGNLAKLLTHYVAPAVKVDATALQWYGHCVDVKGQDCVILMELQSRYAMVFCGDALVDLRHFSDTVQERLWREVCVITQLEEALPDEDIALLSDIALDISSEQHFQKGTDPSVMAHISQVADQLRYMVEVEGYPMPECGADAVSFGLSANDMLRKRKGDKNYFVPLEIFRDFWLGLIQVVKSKAKNPKPKTIRFTDEPQSKNNVISVDFKNRTLARK